MLYHAFSPAQESPSKIGESLHENYRQEMATVIHLPNSVLRGCATHGPAVLCTIQRFWNVYKSFGGSGLVLVFWFCLECFFIVS